MRKPHLIDRIVDAVGFINKQEGAKPTPLTHILCEDKDEEVRKESWNYRPLIGMLNCLAHATRPDAMMSFQQCARFCEHEDPKLSHNKAVKRVAKYLIGTKHAGIVAIIEFSKGFVAFDDSDFANG